MKFSNDALLNAAATIASGIASAMTWGDHHAPDSEIDEQKRLVADIAVDIVNAIMDELPDLEQKT